MIKVNSLQDLNKAIWENKDKVLMLYFGATWCGPCQQLKNKLSNPDELIEMPLLTVIYIDVDIEEMAQICDQYSVESLPTQIFISLNQDNSIVLSEKIIGYDWIKLNLLYNEKVASMRQKNDDNDVKIE